MELVVWRGAVVDMLRRKIGCGALAVSDPEETSQELRGIVSGVVGHHDHARDNASSTPYEFGCDLSTDFFPLCARVRETLQHLIGDGYARYFEVEVLGVFEVSKRRHAEQDRNGSTASLQLSAE